MDILVYARGIGMKRETEELVSIVIPIHNSDETIGCCLESLIQQDYKNIEILCIDDGSTDNTRNICTEYAGRDSRIHYYKKRNNGPGSARNYGIDHSKGKYILFVDSDDTLETDSCSNMCKEMKEDYVDFIICGFHLYRKGKLVSYQIGKRFSGRKDRFVTTRFRKMYDDFLINAPWNKMVRTEFLKKYNIRFHENFWFLEDLIFSMDLINCSKYLKVIDKALYRYNYFRPGALTTKYHEDTDKAIMLLGEKLEICLLPHNIDMSHYYADLVHKMLMFSKEVRRNKKFSWKLKLEKEYQMLTNPKFKYYLANAVSRRNKMKVKIWLMKKRIFFFEHYYKR